jgi:hypothetical protein
MNKMDRAHTGTRFTNDLNLGILLQNPAYPLSDHDVVIGKNYPNFVVGFQNDYQSL